MSAGAAKFALSMIGSTLLPIILGCAKQGSLEITESPLPSIELTDLDGKPVALLRQNAGKIVVAVFTRSDCPISNRFAPEIRRLCDRYQSRGVDFFLIYLDPLEEPHLIRRHLEEFDYPCTGLLDTKHELAAYCQATHTPEAAVFDRRGKPVYVGRINDLYTELGSARPEPTTHDLADAIEAVLAGQAVAHPRTQAIGCQIADLEN